MKKNAKNRKLFSIFEIYNIMYKAFRSMPLYRKSLKNNIISYHFSERIMLAVTEVNGCAACSYAHAKMALESGMNEKEINNMLEGVIENVPDNELTAILFAQNYADNHSKISKKSWDKLIEIYTYDVAVAILSTIRVIMLGNAIGIPFTSFIGRFSKKYHIDKRSNLLYEMSVIIVTLPFILISLVHAIIATILRIKLKI